MIDQELRFALQKKFVGIIRGWPRLSEFLGSGDSDCHPQHLIYQLLDAVEEVLDPSSVSDSLELLNNSYES